MIIFLYTLLYTLSILMSYWVIEFAIRFLCQWDTNRLALKKYSIIIVLPVPCSYGKWRLFALLFGVLPVRLDSPYSPWEVGETNNKEAIKLAKFNPDNFNCLWD